MNERLANGGVPVFEALETLVVVLLALLCFMPRLIFDDQEP